MGFRLGQAEGRQKEDSAPNAHSRDVAVAPAETNFPKTLQSYALHSETPTSFLDCTHFERFRVGHDLGEIKMEENGVLAEAT